jgi:hypothetical protein
MPIESMYDAYTSELLFDLMTTIDSGEYGYFWNTLYVS